MYLSKQQKEALKEALDNRYEESRIISLKEVANELGIKQIPREQCVGILQTFCRKHPDYKAVQMMNTKHDSLFVSLTFIDKTLEFDNCKEVKEQKASVR